MKSTFKLEEEVRKVQPIITGSLDKLTFFVARDYGFVAEKPFNPRHLPTIPMRVSFVPAKLSYFYGAYWYVCSRQTFWAFFQASGQMEVM